LKRTIEPFIEKMWGDILSEIKKEKGNMDITNEQNIEDGI